MLEGILPGKNTGKKGDILHNLQQIDRKRREALRNLNEIVELCDASLSQLQQERRVAAPNSSSTNPWAQMFATTRENCEKARTTILVGLATTGTPSASSPASSG